MSFPAVDCGNDGTAMMGLAQSWARARQVPLSATVEITRRCNIRCQHCYNFDRDQPRKEGCDGDSPELTRQELLDLIGDLHQAGCFFLSLTGGEALLHPDLFALMDHATSLNMGIGLLTNGVLLRPGMVTQLASYRNLTRVAVSLYGSTAGTHDAITQAPGSFARTWSGIRLMQDKGIPAKVKFIIMRDNAHEVTAMQGQAEERGLPHDFDLTITARHDGDRGSLARRIDLVQLDRLCRGPLRSRLPTNAERDFSENRFACGCARGNCAITAQGDVQPCMSVPLVAGNVRRQRFSEIWSSSPLFQWIRGLQLSDFPSCAPCAHKSWCSWERGAAVTHSGSYTGTDPLVCARAELSHALVVEAGAPGPAGLGDEPEIERAI